MSYLDPNVIQQTEQSVLAEDYRRKKASRGKPISAKKTAWIFVVVFAVLIAFWVLMLTGVLDFIFK